MDITQIARELSWWQTLEVSLAQPRRFLAQVMTLGTAVRETLSRAATEVSDITNFKPLPGGVSPATA